MNSHFRGRSRIAIGAAAMTLSAVAGAGAQAKLNKYGYPEKHTPQPTSAAITSGDLMTRLYIFADDSMQGRQFGRIGNFKGTNYIAGEVKRLGLLPAGDNGTYFQRLPMIQRHFTEKSAMTVDGTTLKFNTDFVPLPTPRAPKAIQNAPVIFGGTVGDSMTITPEQAAGKVVLLLPAAGPANGGGRGGRGGGGGGRGNGAVNFNPCLATLNPSAAAGAAGGNAGGRGAGGGAGFGAIGGGNAAARYPDAVAIATIDLDALPIGDRGFLNMPVAQAQPVTNPGHRPTVIVRNGQIAVIDSGRVSGMLPDGMNVQQLQRWIDSTRVDSISRVNRGLYAAAHERVMACALTDSIAVSHGATSLLGAGGVAAADSSAMAAVSQQLNGGRGGRGGGGGGGRAGGRPAADATAPAPSVSLRVTKAAAEKMLGRPLAGATAGMMGKTITGSLDFEERDASDWARNVVAVVPGSDPTLKGEYVLVSAHNDHIGFSTNAVDHDSLKASNDARMMLQLTKKSSELVPATPAELAAIKINVDSLHKIRPARKDSISNGADDDGSGSMGILEIAEFISKMPVKPKRSTIFVWQTGEEAGLNGSSYFSTHPTVPVDSIVADINIDMIGRGRAEDIPSGGPTYVGVVGAGFLSKELEAIVAATNTKQKQPLNIDPKFDLPTTWAGYNNIYGRSDHYNYARQCIPIAFFFTGLHGDYHQRTDEPQYIDYPHYSMIANYIKDVIVELGTRPQRPSLEKACIRA